MVANPFLLKENGNVPHTGTLFESGCMGAIGKVVLSCIYSTGNSEEPIASERAHFVDFQGVGSRELAHNLWLASGVEPKGEWVLKDDTVSKFDILQFARTNNAYVIVGYIPARLGKMNAAGMEILVQGDLAMRRPFIVMETNPKKFPNTNHEGARALADFLLSSKVQNFLADFGQKTTGNGPLFHPVETAVDGK